MFLSVTDVHRSMSYASLNNNPKEYTPRRTEHLTAATHTSLRAIRLVQVEVMIQWGVVAQYTVYGSFRSHQGGELNQPGKD